MLSLKFLIKIFKIHIHEKFVQNAQNSWEIRTKCRKFLKNSISFNDIWCLKILWDRAAARGLGAMPPFSDEKLFSFLHSPENLLSERVAERRQFCCPLCSCNFLAHKYLAQATALLWDEKSTLEVTLRLIINTKVSMVWFFFFSEIHYKNKFFSTG